jgi:hypothetical protein
LANTILFYSFNIGETIKVVDGPLMVSMELLKIQKQTEVMVKISEENR